MYRARIIYSFNISIQKECRLLSRLTYNHNVVFYVEIKLSQLYLIFFLNFVLSMFNPFFESNVGCGYFLTALKVEVAY